MVEVPIQFFQSVIAVELAVTGALLFQVRYFEARPREELGERDLPAPWLRLVIAVILGATLFGCLEAMVHGGGPTAAAVVTIGLALSILPILIGVLPPLASRTRTGSRLAYSSVTIVGIALYVVAVAALVILIGR
jgi:hypothetical protein